MRSTRHRRFLALLLFALWVPFYAHCAFETHCHGGCVPVEHGHHHHDAPDADGSSDCPTEDTEHCHDHDVAPVLAKNVLPPLLVVDFPTWMTADLIVAEAESRTVIAYAREPDESPPHLVFTVAALPVRGPSLA